MRAFWDPAQLAHDPAFFLVRGRVRPNLEVPARAHALLQGCVQAGLEIQAPAIAETVLRAAVGRVHPPDYLAFLAEAPRAWAALDDAGPELVANVHPTSDQPGRPPRHVVGQLGWYTADLACPITASTLPSAMAAAACAVAAAEQAAAGHAAYALCRPPGHHAMAARAAGHCYLNNAAIAAEHLRAQGVERVGVLDLDAHHGNGTQALFWRRDDVVVASVHGDPQDYYPWFVGHADEQGEGAGAGCTLNLPLPRGSGDEAWLAAVAEALVLLRRSHVDALVVSLGFDAAQDEPLSFLAVSQTGFARAGAMVASLGRPTALVQEGGYATAQLALLLERFIAGFLSG